jgi:RNA polymerase sigma factor (sigma-70 family)
MQSKSDAQLLRDYAETGSEPAFGEIVTRHTDLVYSAALRQVLSSDLACDVTQNVFTSLARGARTLAGKLNPDASLAGWLCRCARNLSLNLRRDDFRRQSRERQAMNDLLATPETAPDWSRLCPFLDEAMSELSEPDHDALVLRYFKNQDLRAVGLALGISDDAAQKRVSRAMERLREFFAKRGVTVGASGLAVVLSANAVQAAPVGLALTISTAAALTGATLATTATITATKAIAMTALQKTGIAVALAGAVGFGIFKAHDAAQLRAELRALQSQQAALEVQADQASRERDAATNLLSEIREDNQRLRTNADDVLRLRGEVTRLRNDARAATLTRERQPAASAVPTNAAPSHVITYTATVRATVNWDHAMVTGGWRMPSGRRGILFAVPTRDGDAGQILIESRILEVTDEAMAKLGLDRFNTDGQETAQGGIITPEVYKQLIAAAEATAGVDVLSAPRVSTLSGRQARISVTDSHQTPSGEAYTTGPTLDLLPTISADGQAVDIGLIGTINLERATGN